MESGANAESTSSRTSRPFLIQPGGPSNITERPDGSTLIAAAAFSCETHELFA